jgi:hypothetical protein
MKRNALLALAFLTAAGLLAGRAEAASAVAIDGRGYLMTSQGQPAKEIAIQHALTSARQRYGPNVRILASSALSGYCAIAVAWRANGQGGFVAVSLANPSQAEADKRAIANCLKAGGVNPRVTKRWYG